MGPFYNKKRGMFTRYSEIFYTTEINSTFYRFPTQGFISGLNRTAPPGFVFASKLPGEITHEKKLNLGEGVEDDTWMFLDIMRPLGEKLGPILIQLRPKFDYVEHLSNLEAFLEVIPDNYDWAVEFRNNSWLRSETYKLLKKHNVAYTVVDEPLLPPEVHITADFSYVRWHGHGESLWYDYEYGREELEGWVPKIRKMEVESDRVYGYFNNHFDANAVKNAIEFLDLMDMASPEQNAVVEMIKNHRTSVGRPLGVQPLESYTREDEGLSVADLLMFFTTVSRLGRAEKIGDEEIRITKNRDEVIEAEIRDYRIMINMADRVIEHDCDDWRKGRDTKRICKHINKLFMKLPEGQAKEILKEIYREKDEWRFI
jgi:uncharacterized protein YecE (DUF72 family)